MSLPLLTSLAMSASSIPVNYVANLGFLLLTSFSSPSSLFTTSSSIGACIVSSYYYWAAFHLAL